VNKRTSASVKRLPQSQRRFAMRFSSQSSVLNSSLTACSYLSWAVAKPARYTPLFTVR
jgi:hypothetical protein